MLEQFLIDFAAACSAHVSLAVLKHAFEYVWRVRPDLAARAADAERRNDQAETARVAEEAVGIILLAAGTGAITIDGATISALRSATFDHQHGLVRIGNTTVTAPVLTTGGSAGASGQTQIGGNTRLQSQGTTIDIGTGAQIVITGNAKIVQT